MKNVPPNGPGAALPLKENVRPPAAMRETESPIAPRVQAGTALPRADAPGNAPACKADASEAQTPGTLLQAESDFLMRCLSVGSVGQVLIVRRTAGPLAEALYLQKDGGAWTPVFRTDAFIGKNGMRKTREGDGKTPCGDFAVTGAFGILPDPGTAFSYTAVTPSTYACDEDCAYYNRIIDAETTGHRCKGEAMHRFSPQYDYGLTTSFNEKAVYPNGSAIFIHCKGPNPFTAGCVALDKACMRTILTTAAPGMRLFLWNPSDPE